MIWSVINETAGLMGRWYKMGSVEYADGETPFDRSGIEDPLKRYSTIINSESNSDWLWDQVYRRARQLGYGKYIPDRGSKGKPPKTRYAPERKRKNRTPKINTKLDPETEAWKRSSDFDQEENQGFWAEWFEDQGVIEDNDDSEEIEYIDAEEFP